VSVPASEAGQRLSALIEQINADRVALEIVAEAGTAFLVPADEYRSMQETVYLLRSPENARRLRESLPEVAEGRSQPHELIE
jgi:antitoxin YefM